jgi:hypothetical protein
MELKTTLTGETNYYLGGLEENHTYFWMIVATDGQDEVGGPLWRFTTRTFDKLVAHWDFERGSDGPGPGGMRQLKDVSVNANHASIDSATFVEGVGMQGGTGLYLDGDENITIHPVSNSLILKSFSFSFWVAPQNPEQYQPILQYDAEGQQAGTHVALNYIGGDSTVPFNVYTNAPFTTETGGIGHRFASTWPNTISPEWNHVVVTFDKATGLMVFYINGEIFMEKEFSTEDPRLGNTIYLGWIPPSGAGGEPSFFTGRMDEFMIFNYAIDQERVWGIIESQQPYPMGN